MAFLRLEGSRASINHVQTDIEEEGAGPPLWVGCDQSWAPLGFPLTYMHNKMSSLWGWWGGKSVTREALHPHRKQSIPPLTSQPMDCDVTSRVQYFTLAIPLAIQVYQRELAN